MSKPLFANLGFLLQISGLLTIIPILMGLYFGESRAVESLSLACVAFLGVGFLLNALCERKELSFKDSYFLFLLTFILLPLIGSIPFLYTDPFASPSFIENFTNSCFESVSGFTTTGFSFIAFPENLPASLLLYRSLTELMGGVGIVFMLLAFFESRKSFNAICNSIGVDDLNGNLKKTYLYVFGLYSIGIVVFIGIFFVMGFTNIINLTSFVIDTLTGGFQPSTIQIQQYLGLAPRFFTIMLMLFGAVNFGFIYNMFIRKVRKAFSREVILFFLIIAVGTIAVSFASNIGVFDSLYHVVSMSACVGFNYIPLSSFGDTAFSILIVLMLIGGCTFSMAGGIRVCRILTFARTTKEKIEAMFDRENSDALLKKELDANDNNGGLSVSVFIVLFIFTLVLFAIIFTTMGVSFKDALLEMGSALTTNGISIGAISVSMPIGCKWLTMFAMIIGRVEIMTIIFVIFSVGKKIPIKLPSLSNAVDSIIDFIKDVLSMLLDFLRDLPSRIRS